MPISHTQAEALTTAVQPAYLNRLNNETNSGLKPYAP